MTNPSNQTNPLSYPAYVRGIRPALPDSMGDYVDTELEKIQNTFPNLAVAADANTKTQVADLKITVDQNTADISTEQTVRADADSSLSTQINTVTANYQAADSTLQANINSEATARADADTALSDRIDTVAATAGIHVYLQTTEPTGGTYNNGDLWYDTDDGNHPYVYSGGAWVDNTYGQVTTNTAAISTEQQARIDGDSANATSIQTLQTTVNGNTSSIQTLQSSVNGLEAQYGVQLNVNGYVTGFVQNNDGTSGSFIIQADKFALVKPGQAAGSQGTSPFQVVNGVTYIDNAMINNLTVDHLDDGTMTANITQDGNLTMGTGKVIFDNGSVMRVQGVGFGSSNQFIDWFGPHLASLTSCTEANASYYLKTNGSAYFGGALSAGTLRSAAQTTNTSPTAEIDVGPYSSNGNNITAYISYNYSHTYSCSHGTGTVSGDTTTTCVLEGSTNGGSSWTTLATLPVTIHGTVTTDVGAPDQVAINGGSSATVTWNPGASTTLMLRSRITSFNAPTGGGSSITNNVITQNLGVSSTEQ